MRKYIVMSLLCLICTGLHANDNMEERVKVLEKKVMELEKLIKTTPATKPLTTSSKNRDANSGLNLSEWTYVYTEEKSGGYYRINYTLTNTYKKDIKLIDGSIQFKDLLGERLYGIKITPDLKIASGESLKDGGSYRINKFINEQMRMSVMAKEDIVATPVIRKIVFTDNSILEF